MPIYIYRGLLLVATNNKDVVRKYSRRKKYMALLTINTNETAANAARFLNNTHAALEKSLNRLSSGKRINNPADDAGGLAVSVKMQAAIKRTGAVKTCLANAVSFLQTQDGALQGFGSILERIAELKMLHSDVTKSVSDRDNYNTEFKNLLKQLNVYKAETFNGVTLFGAQLSGIVLNETGSQVLTLAKCTLKAIISSISLGSLGSLGINTLTTAIQSVATYRATNGAQSQRLDFAQDMLAINKVNLEAANSRIIDTDVANESTQFTRLQILAQANAAMLMQANVLPQTALKLINS